jgi:hypothetical protein
MNVNISASCFVCLLVVIHIIRWLRLQYTYHVACEDSQWKECMYLHQWEELHMLTTWKLWHWLAPVLHTNVQHLLSNSLTLMLYGLVLDNSTVIDLLVLILSLVQPVYSMWKGGCSKGSSMVAYAVMGCAAIALLFSPYSIIGLIIMLLALKGVVVYRVLYPSMLYGLNHHRTSRAIDEEFRLLLQQTILNRTVDDVAHMAGFATGWCMRY